ncbi:hypothetical protein DSM106972_049010 [Dulcicalothrix desertica PCC 7102]|uniref:Uncharacterized protein n=1 Tax=Dulcicalothrix desertica PCC 7102 TaxID=232991 RepID=A0A3S1CJK3_9CYAN|nr:hypothetical protein [Dulcicalothrix desertica]RUT03987.1 hypothetical protein DSM106972_049010 [Dulcicalothrix desertica PCC 7102]TWH43607.1 hypothetical protein CAL7102_07344 [Dulcicalothrix desertica PCC 7102]
MQLIKPFRKLVVSVLLIGSSIFSVSSAIAQESSVESRILVNVDVIYPVNYLKEEFKKISSNPTQADVVQIGGQLNFSTIPDIQAIRFSRSFIYDPFANDYYNNRNVGGSDFNYSDQASTSNPFLSATFTERKGNPPLTLSFNSSGSNPPALAYNGTSCKDNDGCVLMHYGYSEEITSRNALTPSLFKTILKLRDNNGNLVSMINAMATPIVTSSSGGVTQYLIAYHEQSDPANNGVLMGVWTEIPVASGISSNSMLLQKQLKDIVQNQSQSPRLSYSNSSNSKITISNTRYFLSSTQIPLDQLSRTSLPPTDSRFMPLPNADGTISPGETTKPVIIAQTQSAKKAMTWVINNKVDVNGETYVQARYDSKTNPYSGDTSVDQTLSLLCIRKSPELTSNPIPEIAKGTTYTNSWSGGEVFAIPEVVGNSLLSEQNADNKCQEEGQKRYSLSGFRMAEFHDGIQPSGFGFYAKSTDPNLSISNVRYWVKINDQNANPWSK